MLLIQNLYTYPLCVPWYVARITIYLLLLSYMFCSISCPCVENPLIPLYVVKLSKWFFSVKSCKTLLSSDGVVVRREPCTCTTWCLLCNLFCFYFIVVQLSSPPPPHEQPEQYGNGYISERKSQQERSAGLASLFLRICIFKNINTSNWQKNTLNYTWCREWWVLRQWKPFWKYIN
jgi:hypothetical protein